MGGGEVNVQSEIEALTAKLRPSGSGSLLDRFKNVKPPRAQDFAYLHDPDLLHRLTPVVVGEEDDDAPEPVKAKRKRAPNPARYIRQARKAGERGPVRVEVIDEEGRRVIVTSSNEPDATLDHADEAERAWLERIAANATH
jgi:hypothetical protein